MQDKKMQKEIAYDDFHCNIAYLNELFKHTHIVREQGFTPIEDHESRKDRSPIVAKDYEVIIIGNRRVSMRFWLIEMICEEYNWTRFLHPISGEVEFFNSDKKKIVFDPINLPRNGE